MGPGGAWDPRCIEARVLGQPQAQLRGDVQPAIGKTPPEGLTSHAENVFYLRCARAGCRDPSVAEPASAILPRER